MASEPELASRAANARRTLHLP